VFVNDERHLCHIFSLVHIFGFTILKSEILFDDKSCLLAMHMQTAVNCMQHYRAVSVRSVCAVVTVAMADN